MASQQEKSFTRKTSIVIHGDRVLSADRRPSQAGERRRKSSVATVRYNKEGGIDNVAFEGDEHRDSLRPTHIGHNTDIRRKSVAFLKKELEIDYHIADLDVLCERFQTDLDKGLSSKNVAQNQAKFGKNELTPPKRKPLWLKFLITLVGGFQLLLWIASILSFIAYGVQYSDTGADTPPDNLYLGITVLVVVILLGLFTFYQEYSSGKVMDSFAKLVPAQACVTRDGKIQHIPASDLVVGDIVEVKFGDSIPADIRILECHGLKVDNSSLTGESDPQSRSPNCTDENPMETKNLAFFSTNALEGTGKGLVVAVGDKTCIGRIADLASGMDEIDTPIAHEVSHFVTIISIVAGFLAISFFIISMSMGYGFLDSGIFMVAIIVANVPEGLLVTFTVVLALTAKRMAAKNCVVRQLHAVETLGSCSVICSDKTGTLTQNKMTVSHLWINDKIVDVCLSPEGEPPMGVTNEPGFAELARNAALCSRAKFLAGQDELPVMKRTVNGDASESAILRFMELMLKNVEYYQSNRKKLFEIPFNSSNKWQLSIHEVDGGLMVEMKGAPERILSYCTKIRVGSSIYDMDEEWRIKFSAAYMGLGGLGERVIGFCEAPLNKADYPNGFSADDTTQYLDKGMIFTGLISMIDPPRPGVPEAVQNCRNAGIKVVMVTGDHPITATAIARKVGIISPGSFTREEKADSMDVDVESVDPRSCMAAVIPGHELLELSTDELDDILREHPEIVFARVSPQQKLVIVEAFQRLNYVVAVTGDGVNDSPALKQADIGVAMGISGSDVSKQAADMILLDDNFSSIVTGCEEGRLIFDNLKKCITYLLCANITTLIPFLLYIVIAIPLPLGTIQMLAIVLGTDVLPTIALSYEPPEGDIMKRKPRDQNAVRLVTRSLILYTYFVLGMIESCAGMFAYVVVYAQSGFLPNMLLGLTPKWDNPKVNNLADSYGQEWTYYQRKELEKTGWVAYFCGLVVCQWGNVLVCKCRTSPVLNRLFNGNKMIWWAIIGETLVAIIFQYTPGFNYCISFRPLKFVWWLPALGFTVFLILFDEFRRLILRLKPNYTWWQEEFMM